MHFLRLVTDSKIVPCAVTLADMSVGTQPRMCGRKEYLLIMQGHSSITVLCVRVHARFAGR